MRFLAALIAMWFATAASGQNLTFESISELARKTAAGSLTNEQFWDAIGIVPGLFYCSHDCAVSRQDVGRFGSDAGQDELVKIIQQDYSRFLLLHSVNDASTLVAYVDAGESRYNPAEAKTILSGGKLWLQIKTYPRGGTGLALFPSDWYELYQNRFRRVLSIPSEGHMVNGDPARGFEIRFLRGETAGEIEMLKFVYSVDFFSGSGSGGASIDIDLWQNEGVVTFSRPKGQAVFEFDPRRSEMSKEFVDFIFSYEGADEFKFYRLLSEHLLEIARNPRDRRREWLRQLLDRETSVPSLEPVRKAFANAR